LPGESIERIHTVGVAHATIGQFITLGARLLSAEHVAQSLFHEGAEGATGALGEALDAIEQLVWHIDRRLHEPILPISKQMVKPYHGPGYLSPIGERPPSSGSVSMQAP